jgi:hypothetical protein
MTGQMAEYVECRNKSWRERRDKQKEINYFTGFDDGYHECQKEHEGKYKTAYIKGVRTMANALKDYDRTDSAWTDYFEHTVDKVLKDLLSKEIE